MCLALWQEIHTGAGPEWLSNFSVVSRSHVPTHPLRRAALFGFLLDGHCAVGQLRLRNGQKTPNSRDIHDQSPMFWQTFLH